MELTTKVELPNKFMTLEPNSSVILIGSCFAEHVGMRLMQMMTQEHVISNPFGVLYNPESIAQGLRLLMKGEDEALDILNQSVFKGQDNVWHSWLFSSHYSGATKTDCLGKIFDSYHNARKSLSNASLLIVTFGTSRYYAFNDEVVVANCHKQPQRCFTEKEQPIESMESAWTEVLKELKKFNPSINILFTVSPYRYKKYGFHTSQIQKSKLLLFTDSLIRKFPTFTSYFPAYEIVLDELRDYRFYQPDMLHPSEQAVEIITERFCDWAFSPDLIIKAQENIKTYKRQQHRRIL